MRKILTKSLENTSCPDFQISLRKIIKEFKKENKIPKIREDFENTSYKITLDNRLKTVPLPSHLSKFLKKVKKSYNNHPSLEQNPFKYFTNPRNLSHRVLSHNIIP